MAAKNTVILPNFLAWKFCGNTQFPHQEITAFYPMMVREYGRDEWIIFHSDYKRMFQRLLLAIKQFSDSSVNVSAVISVHGSGKRRADLSSSTSLLKNSWMADWITKIWEEIVVENGIGDYVSGWDWRYCCVRGMRVRMRCYNRMLITLC